MKEETKNIVVCPKHGNKEYDVKPPHYCKNKIGEGCNCICTCHVTGTEVVEETAEVTGTETPEAVAE